MIPRNTKSLVAEFRSSRGQVTEKPKQLPTPPTRKNSNSSPYNSFLKKYSNLEDSIDKLGTRDLVYYFREISEECGYKYVISNIKKDMAIMKRLKENYSNSEICGMIEFLYESEQDYLEKDRLSPNLLASQWINTIYADMKLWVDDKYVPKKYSKTKSNIENREWDNEVIDNKGTKIGIKL